LFRGVRQERVDTMLVTAVRLHRPVEDARAGFKCMKLIDILSIFQNQWGDRILNFKVLGLLRNC
jgi:hypothetical protein